MSAGAEDGAAHERCVGLRRGAAWGCAWAQHGAAHERTMVLHTGAQWCCAGALRGAAAAVCQGACMGGGGASPQAFGVSPAEALTRGIYVLGLQARCVASPQAVGLAL